MPCVPFRRDRLSLLRARLECVCALSFASRELFMLQLCFPRRLPARGAREARGRQKHLRNPARESLGARRRLRRRVFPLRLDGRRLTPGKGVARRIIIAPNFWCGERRTARRRERTRLICNWRTCSAEMRTEEFAEACADAVGGFVCGDEAIDYGAGGTMRVTAAGAISGRCATLRRTVGRT
jgi:hypothetical protein